MEDKPFKSWIELARKHARDKIANATVDDFIEALRPVIARLNQLDDNHVPIEAVYDGQELPPNAEMFRSMVAAKQAIFVDEIIDRAAVLVESVGISGDALHTLGVSKNLADFPSALKTLRMAKSKLQAEPAIQSRRRDSFKDLMSTWIQMTLNAPAGLPHVPTGAIITNPTNPFTATSPKRGDVTDRVRGEMADFVVSAEFNAIVMAAELARDKGGGIPDDENKDLSKVLRLVSRRALEKKFTCSGTIITKLQAENPGPWMKIDAGTEEGFEVSE